MYTADFVIMRLVYLPNGSQSAWQSLGFSQTQAAVFRVHSPLYCLAVHIDIVYCAVSKWFYPKKGKTQRNFLILAVSRLIHIIPCSFSHKSSCDISHAHTETQCSCDA